MLSKEAFSCKGVSAKGLAEVQAKVFGKNETRKYQFTVGGCSNFLALPKEEIEVLGHRRAQGMVRLMGATGMVDVETYFAEGELMGRVFSCILVPAATPLLGYHLLQNLRFKVNPVTFQIEKMPDHEFFPPFLNLGGRVVWN